MRVKTNKTRGGTIENLYFRNIKVGEVAQGNKIEFAQELHYDNLTVNGELIK